MLDPQGLIRFETDSEALQPAPGVLLVAMGAFIDAGKVAGLLGQHLIDSTSAQVVATFDVDQIFDYRGRRPSMVFQTNRFVSYEDPALVLYRLADREGVPYYLLIGPEPDYQWERMVEAIRLVMDHFRITLVVSTHGIPMAVPHTRPVGLTMHATDPALVGGAESPFGTVQIPGSFAGLLELRLGESGKDALGIAVHVPHYLAQAEFPDGALTALTSIADVTGLNLPNDDLVSAATANRVSISQQIAASEEATALVASLEQQFDAFVAGLNQPNLLHPLAGELPSADELGAEFEQFLRDVTPDA